MQGLMVVGLIVEEILMVMMSSGLTMHQPMRVICVKMVN